ncbi:MAG: DUF3592 domain-containing protein [Gaiellales bacterium]|nr:MAG: DUF3592 domain-containing protein [Gaiellales bacterium]
MINNSIRRSITIGGLVLVLPGLVLFAIGLWQFFDAREFVKNGVTTEGRVMKNATRSSDTGVVFSPVFEFSDEAGNRYLKESDTASYPAKYQPGDSVEVIYQPDNPIDARIASSFSVWGNAGILLAIGSLFLFSGIASSLVLRYFIRSRVRRFSQKIMDDEIV